MRILPCLLLPLSLSAVAEVKEATPSTFLLAYTAELEAPAPAAFDAIARLSEWWSPAHTYSGKSSNLSLDFRAGGCWCERWEGGAVEHARVVQVLKDRVVRLEGALGPLQAMAVPAIWHFEIKGSEGRSTVTMTYRARGAEAGLDKLAPIVDKVMGEAFGRYVAAVKKG